MKVQLNIFPFIGALAALVITILIGNGTAQEHVHFADPLNEMATAFMAIMLAVGCLICSFEKLKK